MKYAHSIKKLSIIALAAWLSACGAKNNSGSTDSSSRSTTATSSNVTLAACNQSTSTNSNFKFNIETLYENGLLRTDLMRAKFSNVTNNFSSGTNYFQMWRWQANSSGSVYLDPTPVKFKLESISSGKNLTGFISSMKWSDVSALASSLGVSTPAQFFNLVRMTVDIRDTNGEFDALKVVYYDSSTNQSLDQTDILLPYFAINPTDYATQPDGSARPAILNNIHPFKSMSGWTNAQLTSIANGYCF